MKKRIAITGLVASTLLVLLCAAWWWVTWPERTAREFARLLEVDEIEQVRSMVSDESAETLFVCSNPKWNTETDVRSWQDILAARGRFRIDRGEGVMPAKFIVLRGQVTIPKEHLLRSLGIDSDASILGTLLILKDNKSP